MITSSTVVSSSEVAGIYTNSGRLVTARAGTPLALLVRCHRTVFSNGSTPVDTKAAVLSTSRPLESEYSEHCEALSTISKGIAQRLRRSVNTAKNVINPLIREINVACQKSLSSQENANPANVNIAHYKLPDIYLDNTLETLLEQYRTNVAQIPSLDNSLMDVLSAAADAGSMLETMRSSSEVFNVRLDEFFASNADLKYSLFQTTNFRPHTTQFYSQHGLLVTFLFLKGVSLGKNPQIPTGSLNIDQLTQIAKYLGAVGGALYSSIQQYSKWIASGEFTLTSHYPDVSGADIGVQHDNYVRWLEVGGTADALIGFYLSNNALAKRMLPDDRNQVKFWEEAYVRYVTKAKNKTIVINRGNVEYLVKTTIGTWINENVEDTQVRIKLHGNLMAALPKYVYTDNIDLYALSIINDTLGEEDNSKDLLVLMNSYLKADPSMSVAKAAAMANTKLIARWLTSQMDITSVI